MKNLFVGNLPHSTTEEELRALFSSHGNVEKVSLVTDRETDRSRGFAFVEMSGACYCSSKPHSLKCQARDRFSGTNL